MNWKIAGLSWRDAESQAFVEVWHKFRTYSKANVSPSVTPPATVAE